MAPITHMETSKKTASNDCIIWSDEWSVGHAVIDYDHQMLINITNTIWAMKKNPNTKRADVGRVIDQLIAYTEKHFAREEEIFGDTDYPDAVEHKKMHQALAQTIRNIRDLYMREGDTLNLSEIADFLRRWLMNHILKHDKNYASYIARGR